ncbi:MAG TPA: hypothetical protein VN616_00935 [Puia sp.]|nr:hypothetical protein [Puia sp.]
MELTLLRNELNTAYGLALPETPTIEALEPILAEKVNDLINTDFTGLVQILYRIDVSEERLKKILRENRGIDAGLLIARLMIERQWQKIETRRKFNP